MQKLTLSWGKLAYEISGKGSPTFLLIHNAGGNHLMMKASHDYYSEKGKAVSVDLRGHGNSDAPTGEYTLEALAKISMCFAKSSVWKKLFSLG